MTLLLSLMAILPSQTFQPTIMPTPTIRNILSINCETSTPSVTFTTQATVAYLMESTTRWKQRRFQFHLDSNVENPSAFVVIEEKIHGVVVVLANL